MKKSKITILLFIIHSVVTFAQNIDTKVPVLSPQTPTTADLGKYGDVQVNESSGKIAPSIPLFSYKVGNFEIPLVLNYSGNGVRVNQDPTWAGINWNINPSGVITRVVNDLPDEQTLTENRWYFSKEELNNLSGAFAHFNAINTLNCTIFNDPFTTWFQSLKNIAEDPTIDTEVDIFNYNFLDFSGSFYLDKENNVHIIKQNKELKILFWYSIYDNKSSFLIVTADGNQYHFGGPTASESSRTFVNYGAGSTVNIPYVQNAFYLYNIKLYNDIYINFNYENYDANCSVFKIGVSERASSSTGIPDVMPCNKVSNIIYNDMENAVVLKTITNTINNEKVEFKSTKTGKCNSLIKLNEIELSKNNSLIKRVKLNYLIIENEIELAERKFFLENVEFYNRDIGTIDTKYELYYNNPGLFPSKSSFAQDHFGFYNGVDSNTTLLPITSNDYLNNRCAFGLADREAKWQPAQIGSLRKIIYPTKGYSEFEYELPYKGEEDNMIDHAMTVYYRDPTRNYNTLLTNTLIPTLGVANDLDILPSAEYSINSTKKFKVKLNINTIGTFTHQNHVRFEVFKKGANGILTSVFFNTKQITNTSNNNTFIEDFKFTLEQGSYVFKLSLNLHSSALNNLNSVVAQAILTLPLGTKSVYHPGLRIKKIKNYDTFGNEEIKRYFYNYGTENLETFNYFPVYINRTKNVIPSENWITTILNISTSNIKSPFGFADGSDFVYPTVTISFGGDNFENGGKKSTYFSFNDQLPEIYNARIPTTELTRCNPNDPNNTDLCCVFGGTTTKVQGDPDPNEHLSYANVLTNELSYQNGTLLKEEYFRNDKKNLKVTTFDYQSIEKGFINNIKPYKFVYNPSPLNHQIEHYYFLYKKKTFNYRLLSTTTKEYVGPFLTDVIESTTNYEYKPDKVSLPSKIETTNSSNEILTTKIFYPSDVNLLSNLTVEEISSLNALQQRYKVGSLVRTENYTNSILTGSKQISFGSFGSKIYPKKISTFKGAGENNLEDKIQFFSYFYGNPSLLAQKDGPKIKYEYNSDHQVVLKIENYTQGIIQIDENDSLPIQPATTTSFNADPCYYQNLYPESMVTKYDYDPVTKNLIKITDPKCDFQTYHYDNQNRLEFVKDKNKKIISENKYNYKN